MSSLFWGGFFFFRLLGVWCDFAGRMFGFLEEEGGKWSGYAVYELEFEMNGEKIGMIVLNLESVLVS